MTNAVRRGFRRWSLPLAVALAAAAVSAEQPEERPHARARLVSEHQSLTPGTTAWLGLTFDIDEHWHLYWKGLNDTGFPIHAQVTAPEGFTVGEMAWPAPVRHVSPGDLLDHIYEKRVTLLIPVEIPTSAAAGSVASFAVDANWLVCEEACLPGSAKVKLDVPVGKAGSEPVKGRDAALFDESRALVPKKLTPETKQIALAWDDGTLVVTSTGPKELAFYPSDISTPLGDLITRGASKDGRLSLSPVKPGEGAWIAGVVELGRPGKGPRTVYWVEVPIPGANPKPEGASKKEE